MAAVRLSPALHLRPPAPGQGGGPARHRARPREDGARQPARALVAAGDGCSRRSTEAKERLSRDRARGPSGRGAARSTTSTRRSSRPSAGRASCSRPGKRSWQRFAPLQEAQKALAAAPEGTARDAAMNTVREVRAKLRHAPGETGPGPARGGRRRGGRRSSRSGPASRSGKMRERPGRARCSRLEDTLGKRIKGQPAAIRTVAEDLRTAHAGIRNPGHAGGRAALRRALAASARPRPPRARRRALRRRALHDLHQHERVPGEAHRLAPDRLAARLRRLRRGRDAHRGGAPAALLGRAARRVREGRPRGDEPLLPGVRQGDR